MSPDWERDLVDEFLHMADVEVLDVLHKQMCERLRERCIPRERLVIARGLAYRNGSIALTAGMKEDEDRNRAIAYVLSVAMDDWDAVEKLKTGDE